MPDRIYRLVKNLLRKRTKTTDDPEEETMLIHTIEEYREIISRHLPYFNGLTEEEKIKFIRRVYRFHHSKRFHFVGLAEDKEVPLLISAVAVQITFGLRRYLLPFFKDIYITADAYQMHGAGELYIGHVSPKGIYISWKHFLHGFADHSDGFNVAYHELAHAVHRENFINETGIDWDFREDFAKLSHVYGPLLSEAIVKRKSYLRGYAFQNFDEFWAVSVEAFFENPQGLKENLPHLYKILCQVLNQDPMVSPKLLSSSVQ